MNQIGKIEKSYSYTIPEGPHKGETLWSGRYCAVSCVVLAKEKDGKWYVLINKRGKGCPTAVGKWNVPAGYLDHDEDICSCGMRETYEETGLIIPRALMNFYAINSVPDTKRQNVNVIYYVVLPGVIDDYQLTTEHSEPDEVDDIMFIPISMIFTSDIQIAFNNDNILLDVYNKIIINHNKSK